jgi:glycosyltransferase involved in cell wall biosynthesis
MIHLFLNGSGANAGGGLTYLSNVIPHLSMRNDLQVTAVVSEQLQRSLGKFPRVSFLTIGNDTNAARRYWQEQTLLPSLIRQSGADVLIATGNFALRKSPVPQILLSRNSLYLSAFFFRDLVARREYLLWCDTRIKASLAKRSIAWADLTVAPTAAFSEELRQWTGTKVIHIPHGFDRERFAADQLSLPDDVNAKLKVERHTVRLLLVSHYNYYRNFETVFRALKLLREALGSRPVKLFLTCSLRRNENPGSYRTAKAEKLVRDLGIEENIVQLGTVPHHLLHQVYRSCDLYVTAAYAESFAHPLVEAMASGLPIVASDLPVHRELCAGSAVYFNPFSAKSLAEKIVTIVADEELARHLAMRGAARVNDFSWRDHVTQLVTLSEGLLENRLSTKS